MNEKILITPNKKLKLMNVLVKELRNISIDELDSEIKKFINFIEVTRIQTRGPIVTCSKGLNLSDDNMTIDYDIMIQLIQKNNFHGYKMKKEIMIPNCLYAHFSGRQEDIGFVQSKLNLFIWENDLIETGEEYTVHLKSQGDLAEIDIFKPMEKTDEII